MKTIIAPIDFSDASTNALAFAAELAKRASARLIAVNILGVEEDEANSRSKLKAIESDLKCETLVARGDLINSLVAVMEAQHPDLIVMGTKGASGLKRILIGSNTVNVIAKTTVPIFVIPEVA